MEQSKTSLNKIKTYILLHGLFLIYSMGAVCSKIASTSEFLSLRFIMFYGLMLLILVFYALFWQQVLKVLPLTSAFSNKAVTVIWGMIWGVLLFQEKISVLNMVGATIIVLGVVLVGVSGED